MAALPESILEAELFGHEKGAFTGADSRKIGLFEQAAGSTLFLDEVGDLKRDLQVKLLRALQEREILRVGGTERVKVDVRIVAATNQDLERDGARGPLPRGPLLPAQRHPDRAAAAARAAHGHPAAGRALPRRSTARAGRRSGAARRRWRCSIAYDWPGNVRELESVIERALLLGEGEQIVPDDLPAAVRARIEHAARPARRSRSPTRASTSTRVERSLIAEGAREGAAATSRAPRACWASRRRTLQYRLEKMQDAPATTGANDGD